MAAKRKLFLCKAIVKQDGAVIEEQKRFYSHHDLEVIRRGAFLIKESNPEMDIEIEILEEVEK
jgi:hypothetical protein